MVTHTRSPYQQNIMQGLFSDVGKKTMRRFTDNRYAVAPALAFFAWGYFYQKHQYDQISRSHWH
jgi:hypothetical protein